MYHKLINLQRDFVNLRNGVFIHFNSATQQFHDSDVHDWDSKVSGKNDPNRHIFDPISWNPWKLDCHQWADIADSGKARFAALTAKHHEGFCIWSTQTTDHCIRNSTCKTDVVKEYLTAFRQKNIVAGLYFSMLDLQHDITSTSCTKKDKLFIKMQLKELLENYGKIPFIIFDGWNAPWGGPTYKNLPFKEINDFVKSIQPNCLVMNIGNITDLSCTDIIFFENAYGQNAPKNFSGPGAACNLFTRNWFWKDVHQTNELKTAQWAVEKVEEYNSKNISFLMNISPNNTGIVDKNLAERFQEFGKLYKEIPPLEELPSGWLYRTTNEKEEIKNEKCTN